MIDSRLTIHVSCCPVSQCGCGRGPELARPRHLQYMVIRQRALKMKKMLHDRAHRETEVKQRSLKMVEDFKEFVSTKLRY